MQVKDVDGLMAEYKNGLQWDGFRYAYSKPWYLKQWREERVPGETDQCVYLLSKPASPNWSLPLEANESDLWYVGKSDKGGGRIWDHFKNQAPISDFPKRHRWTGVQSVPTVIQNAISEEQCVAYVICLEPIGKRALPIAVEKFIMSKLYQRYGQFPVLNLEA